MDLLKICRCLNQEGVALCLLGYTGTGKTSRVIQLSRDNNLSLHVIVPSLLNEGFSGYRIPNRESRVTEWYPPDWLIEAHQKPCVILFDELDKINFESATVLLDIIARRALGNIKLHDDTILICAANQLTWSELWAQDSTGQAILGRTIWVYVRPDEAFEYNANKYKIQPFRCNLPDLEIPKLTFLSPRHEAAILNCIYSGVSVDDIRKLFGKSLPEGALESIIQRCSGMLEKLLVERLVDKIRSNPLYIHKLDWTSAFNLKDCIFDKPPSSIEEAKIQNELIWRLCCYDDIEPKVIQKFCEGLKDTLKLWKVTDENDIPFDYFTRGMGIALTWMGISITKKKGHKLEFNTDGIEFWTYKLEDEVLKQKISNREEIFRKNLSFKYIKETLLDGEWPFIKGDNV